MFTAILIDSKGFTKTMEIIGRQPTLEIRTKLTIKGISFDTNGGVVLDTDIEDARYSVHFSFWKSTYVDGIEILLYKED